MTEQTPTTDRSPAAASPSQPSINPQYVQLQFYRQVIVGELALVNGALAFFEGLPQTIHLGEVAQVGRDKAIAAARTLCPLLAHAADQVEAQLRAIEVPGPAAVVPPTAQVKE